MNAVFLCYQQTLNVYVQQVADPGRNLQSLRGQGGWCERDMENFVGLLKRYSQDAKKDETCMLGLDCSRSSLYWVLCYGLTSPVKQLERPNQVRPLFGNSSLDLTM